MMQVIESEIDVKSKYEKSLDKARTRYGKLWVYTIYILFLYFFTFIQIESNAAIWEGSLKWILAIHLGLFLVLIIWTYYLSNKLFLKADLLSSRFIEVREYISYLSKADYRLRIIYFILLITGSLYIKKFSGVIDVDEILFFVFLSFLDRNKLLDPMEWVK